MGVTQHTTWKPPFPVTDPTQLRYYQSLSQWLRVPWTHCYNLAYAGSSTTTSADMPSATATLDLRKLRDETLLVFQLMGGAYAAAVPAVINYDIRINGASYACGRGVLNVVNNHTAVHGQCQISDIPAGVYTWTVRWYHTLAAATVDSNDFYSIVVSETNDWPDR